MERRPRERRPDEGEPPARGREVHDVDDEEDAPIVDGEEGSDEDAEDYSKGPHFLLGYRYLGLYDWIGEGHTNALSIEGFPLAQRISWLRIGLGLDVGFRRVDPHTDWLMRGFVTLGFQYPRRVTPYGAFTVGGGTMYRKRFGQGMTDGLFSFNVDAGATFKITRTFVADLSVGYMYSLFADLQFNSVTFRFAIGW